MTASDFPPSSTRPHRIWLVISGACLVPAVLDALQTYFQAVFNGEPVQWQAVVFQGTEWIFLGALLPVTYHLGRRFPLGRERWKSALAVHIAGAMVLGLGWATLGVALGELLGRYPAGNYINWVLTSIPWSVFMYFTVLGCVFAVRYAIEAREREAHASRAKGRLTRGSSATIRWRHRQCRRATPGA
jgi:two-component system, LytTR family, sensor kinase